MNEASAPGNPYGYPAPVWRLFNQAPRAGAFAAGTAGLVTGEAGSDAAQLRLRLQLRIAGARVVEARFLAYGCPTTIAVGAWLAQWCQDRPIAALRGLRAADLRAALEIADDRAHCALAGEDALRNALENLQI